MPIYILDGHRPAFTDKKSVWVAPSSEIIGKVSIGADVSIWFGAVLRGDLEKIEIGKGSNIQDLSVIHTDKGFPTVIKEGCTIGHRAIIHGAFIEAFSLIGMGAVLLNGARIGRECLVGAGSLVTEGKTFPDRSLIMGSPARYIRDLTDDEVKSLHQSAKNYQQNAQRFLHELEIDFEPI